jgi:hypothetical protein
VNGEPREAGWRGSVKRLEQIAEDLRDVAEVLEATAEVSIGRDRKLASAVDCRHLAGRVSKIVVELKGIEQPESHGERRGR